MDKGTPEWGKHLAECVAKGHGVMITENIAVVRNFTDEKHGVGLEVGDIRTGKSVDIRATAAGRKVEAQ